MKDDSTFLENNKQNIDLKIVIVLIVLAITIVYLVSKNLLDKNNEKAILKAYEDIIITTQNKPDINIDNIIYLTSLKDLINIAINNNANIFNYQNNYYIIIDNVYYIYKIENLI